MPEIVLTPEEFLEAFDESDQAFELRAMFSRLKEELDNIDAAFFEGDVDKLTTLCEEFRDNINRLPALNRNAQVSAKLDGGGDAIDFA